MDAEILRLLDEYGSLGHERLAELSGARPEEVRQALERLRERGHVGVLAFGVLQGKEIRPTSLWRLTDAGRAAIPRNDTTLVERAEQALERSKTAQKRAWEAHQGASELHQLAADFHERHAALERREGHDQKAAGSQQQADSEHRRAQNEATRADDAN